MPAVIPFRSDSRGAGHGWQISGDGEVVDAALSTVEPPIVDRDAPGSGFTHKPRDRVRVSTERLGVLENRVTTCEQAPP